MDWILAPILIGFLLIMVGITAAAHLAQAFEEYVEPPAQADEEAPYEHDLRRSAEDEA